MNQFKNILETYPQPILSLWQEALNLFPEENAKIDAIISFGSFINGDFTYVTYRDILYIVSDFEFSVITKREPSNDQRKRLHTAVHNYNIKHSNKHLGFNMNIKIVDRQSFLDYLATNPFLCNSFICSGVTVKGNSSLLQHIISLGSPKTPLNELFVVAKQMMESLLIQLDSRIPCDTRLYPLYATKLIAKTIAKFSFLYAVRERDFPININGALKCISNRTNSKVRTSLIYAEKVRSSYIEKQNNLNGPIVDGMKVVINDFMGFVESVIHTSYAREQFERVCTVLEGYLSGLQSNSVPLRNRYEEKRYCLALSLLKGKGENYNYYKIKYGLA